MKTTSVLCLAAFLAVSSDLHRKISAAEWRAVEQPELKGALENAPLLQTESLGKPARGVNVWERWLVPNHDRKTWDLMQIYFNARLPQDQTDESTARARAGIRSDSTFTIRSYAESFRSP